MPGEIVLAGTDENKLLEDALKQLRLPREAVEYTVSREDEDELLSNAKPQIELHIRVRREYVAEQAEKHLRGILDILGVEYELEVEEREGIVFINIVAEKDAPALIGRRGENLDAWQYLITRMIIRSGRDTPLVIIDIESYRQRQFEKLQKLAERAIKRARETGNEIELDPMPSLERKSMHHYRHREPDIRTFSRGDEPERYLVILSEDR